MAAETNTKLRGLQIKLQLLKRHHGIDDAAYRDRLEAITGKRSSKGLTVKQLAAVLNSYAAQEVYPPVNKGKGNADKPKVKRELRPLLSKIEALLAEKGRCEGKRVPWGYALAILKRQGGPEKIEWADREQLGGIITALIKDATRHGRQLMSEERLEEIV